VYSELLNRRKRKVSLRIHPWARHIVVSSKVDILVMVMRYVVMVMRYVVMVMRYVVMVMRYVVMVMRYVVRVIMRYVLPVCTQ